MANINSLDDIFNSDEFGLLNIENEVKIHALTNVPKVEKKVLENSYKQDEGYGEGYNDVADYNIGDNVPFELIGTLPNADNFAAYAKYNED